MMYCLHLAGITHNDLHLQNIMVVTHNTHVRTIVIDFDIAKSEQASRRDRIYLFLNVQAFEQEYYASHVLQDERLKKGTIAAGELRRRSSKWATGSKGSSSNVRPPPHSSLPRPT